MRLTTRNVTFQVDQYETCSVSNIKIIIIGSDLFLLRAIVSLFSTFFFEDFYSKKVLSKTFLRILNNKTITNVEESILENFAFRINLCLIHVLFKTPTQTLRALDG